MSNKILIAAALVGLASIKFYLRSPRLRATLDDEGGALIAAALLVGSAIVNAVPAPAFAR